MAKKLNPQAVLEFVCFAAFAAFALYLVISGKYLLYVTRRVTVYICFTAIVMFLWACSAFRRLFIPSYRIHAAHCFVLILPIIVFLIPHSQLNAAAVSSGYMTGASITEKADSAQNKSAPNISSSSGSASAGPNIQSRSDGVQSDTQDSSALTVLDDGEIEISDQNFYSALSEISSDIGKYEGKNIIVKGYVYRDPSVMSSDEFVPARLLMYCCTADLTPCGFLCRYGNAASLTSGSWVTVKGTVHFEKVNGENQPVISASSVSPAEKPKDEYVYPW